ncbi:hypothetical protein PRZ48_009525 [Zasmidium cellare]|uniref:Uncharacterized protein n=1 Tax=Zasmidium cellare TaxID=395010 RepID=A0ABR0ED61_ZASCE|nr:hypothetical protein PRZ48_009525 [Zasmidium cellare]
MPPFISRKREHSPERLPPAKRQAKAKAKDKKPTLFEAADTPTGKPKSSKEAQEYLDSRDDDDDDDDLSDVDSDEFEDVQPSKKQKTSHAPEEDGDEDEMDWEDAIGEGSSTSAKPLAVNQDDEEIGDISISLNDDGTYVEPLVSLATGKKGPSKRERQIRVLTHCLHVQTLLWHNTVRNSWLNDKEVHKILLDGLTDGVRKEITRWREAMGTLSKEELEAKKKAAAAKNKSKKGGKGKAKSSGRDWNYDAQHTEQGVPNLSGGDPLLRLLKMLTAYWRKRFTVTAPALRKSGYMPLKRLREDIKAWEKDRSNAEEHGERIESREAFRELARKCEGSRDVGGQLFVALLRAIGLETRLVTNLQPAGLGWSKAEEANPKKSKKEQKAETAEEEIEAGPTPAKQTSSAKSAKKAPAKLKEEKPKRKSMRGNQGRPINLDDSGSSLSEPPSSDSSPADDDDDLSVIDVTPPTPKKSTKKYDRDLAFPTYWAEVCSPVSHKFIPVDPIVLSTIASNDELLQTFEPRGKKAENSKQVICYAIAFSADGTAKDVTVRYLKKHQLPGKTKGMRMPAEKIPIYNKRGKVKKYEDYDWFRTVMSLYDRPEFKRTTADDLEEQTDLKPFKAGKEEKEVEKESLQWYKQSADFVLELHLRREEAIKPGSKPVKKFSTGKGDKAKEHDVYRRDDVVSCKTVESWHKEGRMIKEGAQPMKHVPMRAVTLIRKREMEDALRETGEKLQQGLYSWDQTDWIIPPPIENGVIPKNAFGNMDVYVDTMVPKGAVHLPLKGTAKICRKLEIDYAEACTGFEFGKQRAVPVLTGVVVAKENAQMVREAWRADQAEIKRKEDTKRTDAALHWWRKMLMGLRIIDRMRVEYANSGGAEEEINPFVKKAKYEGRDELVAEGEANAGGFFRPGHEEEEVPQGRSNEGGDDDFAGGFMAEDEDENEEITQEDAGDGGFLIEEDAESLQPPKPMESDHHTPVTPISLQSLQHPPDAGDDETQQNADEDDEPEEPQISSASAKTKGTRSKKTAPTSTKSKAKARGKPTSDEEESSLSDPEDDEPVVPSRKRSSPKVIITPQAKAKSSTRARPSRSAAKKVTPVRSQYFTNADDDEEDEQSSEQEVVKPKRTTARTRAKRT